MAGHALVLHDARDTGELVLHIVQPLRRGGGTGQQHEGCGSQQFFLHIVLLGGRCRDGITGFAGIAGAFFHKWCIMSTVIFTIIKITCYFLYIFMDDIRTAHSIIQWFQWDSICCSGPEQAGGSGARRPRGAAVMGHKKCRAPPVGETPCRVSVCGIRA